MYVFMHCEDRLTLTRHWAVTNPDAKNKEGQLDEALASLIPEDGDLTSWAIIEDAEWIQAAKELGKSFASLD